MGKLKSLLHAACIFVHCVKGCNSVIFLSFDFKNKSILMYRRSSFEQFQEIPIFETPIIWCGATPSLGPGTLETPKKLANWVAITAQLLTRNQNFQNISAHTTPQVVYSMLYEHHFIRPPDIHSYW